ncbi:MAG: hypothetical protein K2Y40_05480 [Reyranella sp.]|nr:hypothetical protein [Reyranella sp.]
MGNLKGLVAMGTMLVTAGCVEATNAGYPTTSYGNGYHSYSQPAYYGRPAYYPQTSPVVVVTQTRYVPVAVTAPGYRYERDRNRDGIPDRYQRWRSY